MMHEFSLLQSSVSHDLSENMLLKKHLILLSMLKTLMHYLMNRKVKSTDPKYLRDSVHVKHNMTSVLIFD